MKRSLQDMLLNLLNLDEDGDDTTIVVEIVHRIVAIEAALTRLHPSWDENWHDPHCQCSVCV
jgi:hypothetical protein